MPLTARQIDDLVTSTLDDFGKKGAIDAAQSLQFHQSARFFKKDKVKIGQGTQLSRRIRLSLQGTSGMVGLASEDVTNIPTLLTEITVPWRHATANWCYVLQEMRMNRGAAQLVALIKEREIDGIQSMWENTMEPQTWSKPSDSSDTLNAFGIPYWVVKNATAGFNGGNPTGFSSGAGGINSTTHPHWANYTFSFNEVSDSDLFSKVATALRKCHFISPISQKDFESGVGQDFACFTNEATLNAVEQRLRASNDNLNGNALMYMGQATFKRVPIHYTPKLDADTDNPIYGLNMKKLYPVCLAGDEFERQGPSPWPYNHNVRVVYLDLTFNYLCEDRRAQFVAYQVAA